MPEPTNDMPLEPGPVEVDSSPAPAAVGLEAAHEIIAVLCQHCCDNATWTEAPPRKQEVRAALESLLASLHAAVDEDFKAADLESASELLVSMMAPANAEIVQASVEHQLANRIGAHPFAQSPAVKFGLSEAQYAEIIGHVAHVVTQRRRRS